MQRPRYFARGAKKFQFCVHMVGSNTTYISELQETSGHFIVLFGIGNREARMAQRDGLVGNRPYWVVVADEFQATVYKRAK